MILKFKVNQTEKESTWVGWFGENLMKVKIKPISDNIFNDFLRFLSADLGIQNKDMRIISQNDQKRLIMIEFPDIAWELFLTAIDK